MSGWWMWSYIGLWAVALSLVALMLGALRELAILRALVESQRSDAVPRPLGEHGPAVGAAMPNLTLAIADGHDAVRLGRGVGGPKTMLIFLTPLCKGCQLAVDAVNAVAAERTADSLRMCVVLTAGRDVCQEFLRLFPVDVPVTFDTKNALAEAFSTWFTPFALLYDEHGELVRKGPAYSYDELSSLLDLRATVGTPSTAVS